MTHTLSMPTTSDVELPLGVIKARLEDFRVVEEMDLTLDNCGEHLWLRVQKSGLNTRDIVQQLAAGIGVAQKQVCWSGLKDRQAITQQWFSVPWPIKQPLPEIVPAENWQLLEMSRHQRRLRIGTHSRNHFEIVVRDIQADCDLIEQRLEQVAARGFPNYFGPQRFGRAGSNLEKAQKLFQGQLRVKRFARGMLFSAARAWLFNRVLAQRVETRQWLQALAGDVFLLEGSNSRFRVDDDLAAIQARVDSADVSPSGPLHGVGEALVARDVELLESQLLQADSVYRDGLEAAGLKRERRALRALATDLSWNWLPSDALLLKFSLRRGVFATSMLQEIIQPADSV